MKRILVAVACLLPFALAAEAGINRHSPEDGRRRPLTQPMKRPSRAAAPGSWATTRCGARFFSRSLLRSIAAEEVIAGGARCRRPRSSAIRSATQAPYLVALSIAPVSERCDTTKRCPRAEFARGDGAREQLTYTMVFERGEWRIDDIAYAMLDGESHSLSGELAAKNENDSLGPPRNSGARGEQIKDAS